MNKEEIKELLEKLKQCDDFHNRCDFLMEHSEITYMLDYITKLQQENQKLKKQLEEERKKVREYSYKLSNYICEETYEHQQKEFVEWLENEKNIYPYDISDYTYEDIINTILSKYEEIIEK